MNRLSTNSTLLPPAIIPQIPRPRPPEAQAEDEAPAAEEQEDEETPAPIAQGSLSSITLFKDHLFKVTKIC